MLYMIFIELQKLWKRKAFLIMLCVIIATNIAMLVYNNRQAGIPEKAYKEFDSQLQKLSASEREKYVGEYAEKVEGLIFIENINLIAAGNLEDGAEIAETMKNQNLELFDKYYNDWTDKNYNLYTDDIFTESSFVQDVKERTFATLNYVTYLEEIAAKETDNLEISIFANSDKTKENVFSKSVIRQTARKYKDMTDIKTDVYTYKWIDNFMSTEFLEILFALLTFILVYQMIYEEKKKQLFIIIRAMPRGRINCIVSKLVALFINTGCVTFLLYGTIFIYSTVTVGIYGLDAPIQSVAEFIACPYKLSVWQFMLLSILIKWIVLFAFGLILLFISILVSHYVITFATGTALLGINAMGYYLVSGASKWNILHYLNMWQFFKSEQVIGNYVLINIFGKPESVSMLMVILLVVIIAVFAIVCTTVFAVGKNLLNEKGVSFKGTRLLKDKISQIGFKQRTYRKVWGYESYKILVMNLGVLIIILFGVGMIVSGKNESCYLTPNEMHYRQWMQNLNGKLTDEKEEQIQNQNAYYDNILRRIEDLEQEFASGEIRESEYDDRKMYLESQLAFYPAFQRVYERYEYVKKDSHRQFVYEEGYDKLIGKKDSWYLRMFMVIGIVLILFLTTTFTTDKEKGMHNIIRTTPRGRVSVVRNKVAISFIGVGCMYLCFFGRNIYIAQTYYGLESFLVSASNLKGFEAVPESISIVIFLVGFVMLQIICLWVLSAIIMFVADKIGNTVQAIVWESIGLLIIAVVVNQIYPFIM